CRDDAELIFQLEHDSLRRFFSEPADLRERRDIGVDYGGLETFHAHSAQDRQRELRTNATDVVDQQSKQVAFGAGHEAVKDLRIFANVKMNQDLNWLSGSRQFVITRKRNENFVADAADVDDHLGGQR